MASFPCPKAWPWTAIMLACFLSAPAVAEEPVAELRIARLIRDLDHDTFRQRRAAQLELEKIGLEAIPLLKQALASESRERRRRARQVLWRIHGDGVVLLLHFDDLSPDQAREAGFRRGADRRGRVDQAVEFMGEGQVIAPDHAAVDTDDAFTLSAWVKPTKIERVDLPDESDNEDAVYPWGEHLARWHGHFILAKWNSSGFHGDYLFAVTPSGQLGLGVSHSRPRFVYDALRTETKLALNQWVHVAATFDQGLMRLYLDGKLEAENRSAKVPHTNRREYRDDDIYVGSLWNNAYNFHGSIDEVCVVNRALSQSEIQFLLELTGK